MKNGTYNAWWREMGAISRGMMFIEGNIAAPGRADPAQHDVDTKAIPHRPPPAQSRPPEQAGKSHRQHGATPMTDRQAARLGSAERRP